MKRQNRGKDFEKSIKDAFSNIKGVSFDRLADPMAGYSGVRNICDFAMFSAPDMFFLECKCLYGNTLNYSGSITRNQWIGLKEKSDIPRCIAGVVVWFIDYDITAFVNIKDLWEHKKSGAKSLNVKDIIEYKIPHFLFDGMKKKVMYSYLGEKALKNLHELANTVWGDYDAG